MRLFLGNPNTTQAVTERIAAAARSIAAPGTEIVAGTASFGAAIIGTRTEGAVAAHAALDLLARDAVGCDGAIIGASLDSGLRAVRQMLPVPVVGITEAALHVACLLGGRFGLLCVSGPSAAVTREMVAGYGLTERLAGMAWLETSPGDLLADTGGAVPALVDAANTLVRRDLADVVVLVGAVMAGVPARVQHSVPVPVIEGVTCAVPLLEGLVRLRVPKATAGSFGALPSRVLTGVGAAIQGRFGA